MTEMKFSVSVSSALVTFNAFTYLLGSVKVLEPIKYLMMMLKHIQSGLLDPFYSERMHLVTAFKS